MLIAVVYAKYFWNEWWQSGYVTLIAAYFSLRDITSSLLVYLSFEWNHHRYKKWCKYCDCVMKICERRMIRERIKMENQINQQRMGLETELVERDDSRVQIGEGTRIA